jgi:methylmalonyl-CoA/ethylmalonyl-CoA epimerase
MRIHHIGYAVKNIDEAFKLFKILGFEKVNEKVVDEERKVKILFVKNNEYLVELIEPYGNNSPIDNILKNSGSTPYHICYESKNILKDIEMLKNKGFVLISELSEAPAINNQKVCFLYNRKVGIIEILAE